VQQVRGWIAELIDRSLLLGNSAGVHLHGAFVCLFLFTHSICEHAFSCLFVDIMLGHVRSRLDHEQMQMQQRNAVRGILRACDEADGFKMTGTTDKAERGEFLDW
jgi:hypothetical protein